MKDRLITILLALILGGILSYFIFPKNEVEHISYEEELRELETKLELKVKEIKELKNESKTFIKEIEKLDSLLKIKDNEIKDNLEKYEKMLELVNSYDNHDISKFFADRYNTQKDTTY